MIQKSTTGVESLQDWGSSDSLGVCVRDRDSKVLFQNDVCGRRCGTKLGERCLEGCMTLGGPRTPESDAAGGIRFFERVALNAGISEVVRIDTHDNLTTIFLPIDAEIEGQKRRLREAGLSKRELEVAELALDGKSNREIAAALFISRATLKTHLNVIYRKVPQLKKSEFRCGPSRTR